VNGDVVTINISKTTQDTGFISIDDNAASNDHMTDDVISSHRNSPSHDV